MGQCSKIGGYQLLRVLSEGGMGVVFAAFDPQAEREVALKVLKTAGEKDLARFVREGQALARMQHPNVVRVHAAGRTSEGAPFLVQDLVPGESLAERLRRTGPLAPREAASIAHELALALEHVHERGVVHRDLKPGNVILTPEGRPVLVDFGVACLFEDPEERLTRTGAGVGTPGYWAPEQVVRSEELGPPADVWGLGALLYALLSGNAPFQGSSPVAAAAATFSANPAPPLSERAERAPDLEAICLRCLEKDVADRYPSAGALAEDLARFLAGEPVLARGFEQRPNRWRWLWLGCASFFATGLAFSVVAPLVGTNARVAGEASATDLAGMRPAEPGGRFGASDSDAHASGDSTDSGNAGDLRDSIEPRDTVDSAGDAVDSASDAVGSAGNARGPGEDGHELGDATGPPRDHDTERLLVPHRVEDGLYRIPRSLTVPKGSALVLDAGARLSFAPGAALVVRGQLWCTGSEADPVVFDRAGNAPWGGLVLIGDGALGVLEGTQVMGAAPSRVDPSVDLHHELGGGVSVLAGARLRARGCAIVACVAPDGSAGGGLRATSRGDAVSELELFSVRVEGCVAERGGGIYLGPRSRARIERCELIGNRAKRRGGGVFAAGGALLLAGTHVEGNSAELGGGAAFHGPAQVVSCTFAGNQAGAGGGIEADAPTGAPRLMLRDVRFEANRVTHHGGGALVTRAATLVDCAFVGNVAGGAGDLGGGGLLLLGPHRFVLRRCVFTRNAADRGPALCAHDGARVRAEGCSFDEDDAPVHTTGALFEGPKER